VLSWWLDRLIDWPEKLNRFSLRVSGYHSHTVEVAYGQLAYVEGEGQGRIPLMLLHGFSAEGPHYVELMHYLRSQVSRLLVPDLPAHGRSTPPPRGMTTRALREQLVAAFDRIIDEPVVLYGNSLGGLVALYYAIARPEKVRGLVLCSPAGAKMSDDELRALLRLFQLHGYEEALAFVDRLFVRRPLLRRLIAWGVQRKFKNPSLKALLDSLGPEMLLRDDELSNLRVPTLLIWGREDRILPRSSLEFFREHLPPRFATIEEPADQSHTPYLEDAETVATRIITFMRSLERARA
jgi:pimeloyl-ACP methyl ester carboxylesterase